MPPNIGNAPHEVHSNTLRGWLDLAEDIEDPEEKLRFVVTGRTIEAAEVPVEDIDPIQDRITEDLLDTAEYTRDYDSLLGFCQGCLPITQPLKLFTIPRPDDRLTIKTNIHVKLTINGEDKKVPLEKVSNFGWGNIGEHVLVRVAFPAMWEEHQQYAPEVSMEQIEMFFNLVLIPALEDTAPDARQHFPADFQAEYRRCRRTTGAITHSQHVVDAIDVGPLVQSMYERTERHSTLKWARDFYFVVEIKGVKEFTRHERDYYPASNIDPVSDVILSPFDIENAETPFPLEQLYVDVALSVYIPGYVTLLRTDAHSHLVGHLLNMTPNRALGVLRGHRYASDVEALMFPLAGLRVDTSHITGLGREQRQSDNPFMIAKINGYSGAKNPTSMKDMGRFAKFLDHKAMVKKLPEDLETHAVYKHREAMRDVYGAERRALKSGCFRCEVRVPAVYMLDVVRMLPDDLLLRSVVCIPKEDWWRFKEVRLEGFSGILEQQLKVPNPMLRLSMSALGMTSVAVWNVNGLNNRPDDREEHIEVRNAFLPRVRSDELDEDFEEKFKPVINTNLFVLHQLAKENGIFRLSKSRQPPSDAINIIFGADNISRLKLDLDRGLVRQQASASNKSRMVRAVIDLPDDPEERRFDCSDMVGLPGVPLDTTELRDTIEEVFLAWVKEIWQKTPAVGHTTKKWFLHECSDVGIDIFSRPVTDLSELFRDYQLRKPANGYTVWNKVFDNQWRPYDKPLPLSAQNYKQVGYYRTWNEMRERYEPEVLERIRQKIKEQYDKLVWVSHAETGKLWVTGSMEKKNKDPKEGGTGGPWLLLNPYFNPESDMFGRRPNRN